MAGTKLVNLQFNSPINLYSPEAIQETLDRQTQVLANGAVGIDFTTMAKPANLHNSAVLRMLEEEERQRAGQAGLKRVAWPPPPEDEDIDFIEQGPVQAKTRGVQEQAQYQTRHISSNPIDVTTPSSQFSQHTLPKGWAPVPFQTNWKPQHIKQELPTESLPDPHSQQSHQSRLHSSTAAPAFEAPPSIITLREEVPISQVPSPVYHAQPAATKAQESGNMRGDQKWPPASVKEQVEAENQARLELAKGPVCRPRRVKKDYRPFFAQHALTTTYPGYRAPPGTQYFTPAYQQ